MLTELAVRDLGVIAELRLVLQPGLTAVTGETGAGKTLVVEAIELLVGGRAESAIVRAGANEASVEGRFDDGDTELVLARVVPASGRSRAYRDGSLATVAQLAEAGAALVDLHGQHAHQSLLRPAAQRAALDEFAGIHLEVLAELRKDVARIDAALAALGGDEHARAREIDLLTFQVGELEAAALSDPDEDAALGAREDVLADATAAREAAESAAEALAGDDGAANGIGAAIAAVARRPGLTTSATRLASLAAELDDVASELRAAAERFDEDPEALAEVRARRQLLRDLQRKYGDTVGQMIAFRDEAVARLAELGGREEAAARLETERAEAVALVGAEAARVAAARRGAAPKLADAVESVLRTLALPRAAVEVGVAGAEPCDEVTILLAANAGEPALPLAKVASGGELARTMLAARLVLTGGPPTMVFDEVDAGVGGEAAIAVAKALADLAATSQVLVVTHLPQVAAFADNHVVVTKAERSGRTIAEARTVDGTERVVELSRMLSGQPGSASAQSHAEELLASAAAQRGR